MVTAAGSQGLNTAFVLQKLRHYPLPSELDGRFFSIIQDDLAVKVEHEARRFFTYYPHTQLALDPVSITIHSLEDPEAFTRISQLNCNGLIYMAAYLKRIKGIDIIIIDQEEDIGNIVKKCLSQGMKRFGVIAVMYSSAQKEVIGHVAPFLISKDSDHSLQIIDLDSKALRFGYYVALKKTFPKATFLGTLTGRQADRGSCTTDALIILQDALLHARENAITDFATFLKPHVLGSKPGYQPFLLPKVWARVVQVKTSVSSHGEDPVVHVSDKATGEGHPETLSAFMARYRVYVRRTATLSVIDQEGAAHLCNVTLVDRGLNGFLRCKANSFRRAVERASVLERTDEAFQRILQEKTRLYTEARPVFDLSF